MSSILKRCGFFALVILISESVSAQFEQVSERRDKPMWRFESANDVFFDSDNQFTNGWNIQKHSALAESVEQLHGVPGFGRTVARWALPEREGLRYRNAFVVGQNMSTSEDIENENIIRGLHMNFVIQGNNVDRGLIAEDIENDFGMISFDYRFK